uniref:Uncharacterized protein n=1 Tax=Strigamia maritima TaxID=126957 RepID=T1JMI4_STRMM
MDAKSMARAVKQIDIVLLPFRATLAQLPTQHQLPVATSYLSRPSPPSPPTLPAVAPPDNQSSITRASFISSITLVSTYKADWSLHGAIFKQ